MGLEDYNFIGADEKALGHIEELHFPKGDGRRPPGSYFEENPLFGDVHELIKWARGQVSDYEGEVLVKTVDTGVRVGYDNLVRLDGLPKEALVTKEPRGKEGYLANVVRGVPLKETTKVTIVAGPYDEEGNTHGFYTIYPGRSAPPFPVPEEEIKGKYTGDELEKRLKENREREDFWSNHGFIVED